jgi:hypothetical protein
MTSGHLQRTIEAPLAMPTRASSSPADAIMELLTRE